MVQPWERQPRETSKAFQAFCVYRDLRAERSYVRVAQQLQKSHTLIGRWAQKYRWRVGDSTRGKPGRPQAAPSRRDEMSPDFTRTGRHTFLGPRRFSKTHAPPRRDVTVQFGRPQCCTRFSGSQGSQGSHGKPYSRRAQKTERARGNETLSFEE